MNESIPATSQMIAWQQVKDRLPVLQRRTNQLRQRLLDLESQLAEQHQTVSGEQADVDRLQGRSLGNYLLTLSHQMDKRQEKEEAELIQARRKLDELTQEKDYLRRELTDLEKQSLEAQQAERQWQAGRQARAAWLEQPENQTQAADYQAVQARIREQQGQLTEIEQARAVAIRAAATAAAMQEQLDSAESWGTYDVWFKGGLISHMAKYDHIDEASDLMNRLTAQLRDLRTELADIRMSGDYAMNEYSSGTRALDYFFDNIFTDLSVRDRIRDDQESVRQIRGQLNRLEQELNSKLAAAQAMVRQLSAQLETFLATMELA